MNTKPSINTNNRASANIKFKTDSMKTDTSINTSNNTNTDIDTGTNTSNNTNTDIDTGTNTCTNTNFYLLLMIF